MLKGQFYGTRTIKCRKVLPPEEAAAKAVILAECDRLTEAGITFVAVQFDGSKLAVQDNLIYWNEAEHGGHFAAFEQPDTFVEEMRSAFRKLREQ